MTGNVALTQCVLSTVPLRVENGYLLGASLTELRNYFFRTSSAKHRRIESFVTFWSRTLPVRFLFGLLVEVYQTLT